LTNYINVNKAHNILQIAPEISGMKCHVHPSI